MRINLASPNCKQHKQFTIAILKNMSDVKQQTVRDSP